MPGVVMDVEVILGDEPLVRVTDVHPIALSDAITHAVEAALRLSRELQAAE